MKCHRRAERERVAACEWTFCCVDPIAMCTCIRRHDLPGTIDIEAEITRRLHQDAPFAVCYADLDHFKEFNDRYSYYDGDRVIRILAKILHDVVKGMCAEQGFVGHIGGDDFIFIIPAIGRERDVRRDRVDLRRVGAVSVFGAGSSRGILFRQGPDEDSCIAFRS